MKGELGGGGRCLLGMEIANGYWERRLGKPLGVSNEMSLGGRGIVGNVFYRLFWLVLNNLLGPLVIPLVV